MKYLKLKNLLKNFVVFSLNDICKFEKLSIKTPADLKEKLIYECSNINFNELTKDIKPLVFNSKGLKLVTLFPDFAREYEF